MSRLGLDRRRNPDVIGTILGLVMALSAGAFGVAAEDTAGTARSLSTCSQYASRTFYRYVDATELSDIETSHLLRVRPTGPKYWTDERYDSAQLAQARLALRNRPEQRVAFSLNGRCPQHEGTVMRVT